MNKKLKTATLLFLIFGALTTVVYAGIKTLLTIETSGNLTTAELTSVPTSIDWGNVELNVSVIKSLTVTNIGNVPVADLQMTYVLPPLCSGSLTWDLEGQAIVVGESKVATLNLTMTDGPDGPFNFNITISGDC